ncbi:thioesterase [Aquaspirillum sp. LM1]|jgi:uncharacterized protein (TIGR00369 family)|uniref:PaaI family thioesterase n=1 Tax=Aquaspirillum sp. LM1 TaxID=1938604 RepID=UPI000984034F|nr:PaaI family thioesterase [Aquaspirillum sp. LM1]AQR64763.1 thioesterase [Aquaspirillum sp. LM1]
MSAFMQSFLALRERKDYAGIIETIPYAKLLGVEFEETGEDSLLFRLPFYEHNIGNTLLPALHGGLIGGFLENAGLIHLMWVRATLEPPKVVDISFDYLRSGKPETLYAQCQLTKQGKRVANMLIESWQGDRSKPVAVARAHFLLS